MTRGPLVGLALLAACMASSLDAAAQTVCLHQAGGPSGMPHWWEGSWGTKPRLDPGWAGSAQTSFGASGTFRAVVANDTTVNPSGTSLFLTWQLNTALINSACGFPNARLFLAIADHTGDPTTARVFRFEIHTGPLGDNPVPFLCDSRVVSDPSAGCANPNPECPVGDAGVSRPGGQGYGVYEHDPADVAPGSRNYKSSAPGTKAAEYLHQFGRIWVDSSGLWTINLAIPIEDTWGIPFPIDDGFKMYFEARNCSNAGCTLERWPRTSTIPYVVSGGPGVVITPPMSDFGTVRFDSTCTGGIEIREADVGVVKDPPLIPGSSTPSDPSNYLPFNFLTAALDSKLWGLDGASSVRNVLVARPFNGSSKPINNGEINVTFRIADWGSHADIGTSAGVWRGVPGEPQLSSPTAAFPLNLGPNPVAPGQYGAVVYQWQLTPAERCQYGLDTGPTCGSSYRDDQSVLVELKPTATGVHDIGVDSVVKSMRFVGASTFKDQAVIDITGAPDLPGGARPAVFLFTHVWNMPERAPEVPIESAVERLRTFANRFPQGTSTEGIGGAEIRDILQTTTEVGREVEGGNGPIGTDAKVQAEVYGLLQGLPTDALRFVYPTIEYTAFRETAQKVLDDDGTSYVVLEPMSRFGLHAKHLTRKIHGEDRPVISGWAHALEGRFEEIGKDAVRIPFRPGENQVVLTTIVQAIDDPSEPVPPNKPKAAEDCDACGSCPNACPVTTTTPPQPCPPEGIPTWVWIVIGLLIAAALGLIAALRKKKP